MEKVMGRHGDLTLGFENNMVAVLARLSKHQLVDPGWTTKESRFDSYKWQYICLFFKASTSVLKPKYPSV
jgi:hypothetical protein